ncbi:MAG: helix-turn-helix domain-containing protein, partial [Ideonella sp.]|nr:helix-turn-helix domain-containing protein [Ideonella sp.]
MDRRDTPHPSAAAGEGSIDTADDAGHYRVLLARDARFDGRLFVGVSSTGVYCRPICRVRTPKPQNCRFFTSAAQAEAAAYRPCLKCRPELAPGPGGAWTVMDASRTLARQAAALLDVRTADAGGDASVAALAARLGVSERHLRRIFVAEHGVTPLQYLQTRRLLLAKQLLTDTRLPVTQVALASGWRSLRRFNAAFADSYRLSPSRLRAGRAAAEGPGDAEHVEVHLAYREPCDRARLLAFFAQRALPGIETVEGLGVVRSLRAGALGGDTPMASPAGWVSARFDAQAPLLHLRIAPALVPMSGPLIAAARRWFDLDAQPAVIDAALAALPGEPGLRLPG